MEEFGLDWTKLQAKVKAMLSSDMIAGEEEGDESIVNRATKDDLEKKIVPTYPSFMAQYELFERTLYAIAISIAKKLNSQFTSIFVPLLSFMRKNC